MLMDIMVSPSGGLRWIGPWYHHGRVVGPAVPCEDCSSKGHTR